MTFVHLVARALRYVAPLTHDDVAVWLWSHLTRTFPLALAAVLMPNHLHLVALARDAEAARARLAGLLGALLRSGGARSGLVFEAVPRVVLENDPGKLLRQVRYVALNPVRAGLVDDPLAWRWSTHRDVMGAVASPWVDRDRLAAAVGNDPEGFAAWWHRYVAREDRVPRTALALPERARVTPFADVALTAVASAAASALRTRPEDVRHRGPTRDLFLAVAPQVGWDRASLLARACDVTPRAVQKARRRTVPAPALDAALLCLGDARLRV